MQKQFRYREEKCDRGRGVDFGSTPDVLREEYLDVYEGIHSNIENTARFDENSDLSTTYLGRSDRSKNDKLKTEESFLISEHGYATGTLLDGTECQLLFDTGASKSFMSIDCKSLHTLPKFASKDTKNSGRQWTVCQCILHNPSNVHGHRFKIYTLVSEIHENVDLVLGVKNVFE